MRLADATAGALPAGVRRPAYERAGQAIGIVHLGVGAFHRAHQAVYTDAAMDAGDRGWAISGVSLRSGEVAARLGPQDGLYTLTERGPGGEATRLIGAVREVIVAARAAAAAVARLAHPDVHIVSLTVTEKGYLRRPDGSLDLAAADGVSIYRLLAAAFARRREAGLAGLTIVSCDNLPANGATFDALMRAYLDARRRDLLGWYEAECAAPSTMVDRIVPATTAADRDRIAARLGMRDEGCVLTESFSQWVIEDRFAGPRPRWEAGGATFVDDVRSYETAKLRMLNGAHSALAYLGLERGHDYVHQAIGDPAIRPLIETLIVREAAATIDAAPGQHLDAYAEALLARFGNDALAHRLEQIAADASQKIGQRWLETLAWHAAKGRTCPAILSALAAWLVHVRGDRRAVDDPLAGRMRSLWAEAGSAGIVEAMFGARGLFAGAWRPGEADRRVIGEAVGRLGG